MYEKIINSSRKSSKRAILKKFSFFFLSLSPLCFFCIILNENYIEMQQKCNLKKIITNIQKNFIGSVIIIILKLG